MSENAAAVAAPTENAPVAALTQAQFDDCMQRYAPHMSSVAEGMVEEKMKTGREAMLDADADAARAAKAATVERALFSSDAGRMPKKGSLMGHALAACAAVGQDDLKTTLGGKSAAVTERLEKSIGDLAVNKAVIEMADAEGGGLLIQGETFEDFLEPIAANSIFLSLGPETRPTSADQLRVDGWETLPAITGVDELNVDDVGTTMEAGNREAFMRKFMALLPVTSDWRKNASATRLAGLQKGMQRGFDTGLDLRYLTGDGIGKNISGWRTLVHPDHSVATAGVTLAEIFTDVETAMITVMATDIPTDLARFGVAFAPRTFGHLKYGVYDADGDPIFAEELSKGTWLGTRYRTSTHIPITLGGGTESYILWGAFDQIFVGVSEGLEVRWFENGSMLINGARRDMMEGDFTALRGMLKTTLLVPYPKALFETTAVTYGA